VAKWETLAEDPPALVREYAFEPGTCNALAAIVVPAHGDVLARPYLGPTMVSMLRAAV
jgi:hypothetical protein